MVLDPSTIPLVALESMNQTHREEVELINRLGELLKQNLEGLPNHDEVSDTLDQWVAHTRDHFERENKLMRVYGFPAYPMHSGEHSRVLEQIETLQQKWQERRNAQSLADFLFQEWPNWFDMHVNSMDAVTAQFVIRHGG